MRCPVCGTDVPEVVGAASQVCPRCGAEARVEAPAPAVPARVDPARAFGRAARAVAGDYGAWLSLYLPLALVALAVDLLGLVAARAVGFDGTAPTDPAKLALLVVVALPFELLRGGLGAAFVGLGAALTAAALAEGRPVRPRDGARLLRERGPVLLGAGVVFVAVLAAGLVLLVVPAVFFLHWYLWTTVHVAEGVPPGEAFRLSRDLARRPGMKAVTLAVVLAWVAVTLAEVAVGDLLAPLLGGGDVALAVATALVALPLMPFVPALVGSCLVATRAGTAPAPAATIACPGCGTPVPYAPTGTPQAVTCPVCGRTGAVTAARKV